MTPTVQEETDMVFKIIKIVGFVLGCATMIATGGMAWSSNQAAITQLQNKAAQQEEINTRLWQQSNEDREELIRVEGDLRLVMQKAGIRFEMNSIPKPHSFNEQLPTNARNTQQTASDPDLIR